MRDRFDVQGHRGARGLFPENTIEGFAAALALGVASFELDVAVTADGVAVAHHDPALNPDIARGPDGAWIAAPGKLLRDLTLAELAAYDVGRLRPGSAAAARFPEQAPRDGARIPTLEAVLRSAPRARFNIELKLFPARRDWTVPPEAMAEIVAEVVERAGATSRVMVQSFDWRAVRHLRAVRPGIARSWLTEAGTEADRALWWGVSPGASGGSAPRAIAVEGGGNWAPDHAALTAPEIREAHALGLTVTPWTVNRPEDMARLIGWGVDGLITDRPDLAWRVLRDGGR